MFSFFFGFLLKSSVILGAAWIATALLRKQSAATRYMIWVVAAVAILLLPLTSVFPNVPVLRVTAPAAAQFLFHADAVASPETNTVVRNAAEPSHLMPSGHAPDWPLIAMLLWGAGSLAGIADLLFAAFAVARIRRSAIPVSNPLLADLASDLGINRAVEYLELDRPGFVPMACGAFRQTIILAAESRAWSEERLRIVLLHELAHIRRRDVLTLITARAAFRLCWWNPLAWIAARELSCECERAADDAVLRAGTRATDYAAHLLDIARSVARARVSTVAATIVPRSLTESRIEAILDARLNRQSPGRAGILLASALTLAALIPLTVVRGQVTAGSPADPGALILAAVSQKNPELLDNAAKAAEQTSQYDAAHRLLEAAADIHASLSGSTSAEYGLALLKIADLEYRNSKYDEAKDYYSKAAALIGDRPEGARVSIVLGEKELRAKNFGAAEADFEHARTLDPGHAALAWMWQALTLNAAGKTADADEKFWNAVDASRPDTHDGKVILLVFSNYLTRIGQTDEAEKLKSRIPKPESAPLAELPPDVYRVGPGIKPPIPRLKPDPEYSEEARLAKLSGTVMLRITVGADGVPSNIDVVRSLGLGLDEKAVDAVRRWRFDPGTKDGQPVKIMATIEINFRLL